MKIKFLFFVFLIFSLFWYQPSEVKAVVNCCPEGPGLCSTDVIYCENNLLNCCYPGCPYTNWTNVPVSECQSSLGSPQNVCCTQSGGGCSSACGTLAQWGWCYAASCQVKANDNRSGACDYQYQYSYSKCGAVDSCLDTPYLEAGLCDASGCKVGGDYKTCCQNGSVVACTGGEFSGTCPEGSSPVVNCVGPQCCTGTPGPTATPLPAEGCNAPGFSCSVKNGDAAGCWSYGQFPGQPSCKYCSDTNTCVCGDCPNTPPPTVTPPWQCVDPLWCDIPWTNLTCNPNQPSLYDEECKNRQTPRNEDYVCCSRRSAPAEVYGYVTLNGSGRLGVNNIAPGKNNYDFLSPCTDYPGKHCGDSGSCGSDYIGNLGGLACSSSYGLPDTRVYYNGAEPVWQCKHEIKVCGSNACWDDWWFCRSGLSDGLSFRFAENYGLKASTDSVGLNYQFTATPPAGYTCGTWRLTGSTGTKTGTGCTATNGSMPLYDINSPTKNILVFDLVQQGKISGNVYKNTTGLTCNTGSLQSGRTVTIAGSGASTYTCSLTTNGSGYYDSESCSSKPPRGSSYTVSVSHNATDESCLSCGGSSCSQSVSLSVPSITQNFTIFPLKNAWFQTAYGDLHGNGGVGTTMPIDTCTSATCTAGGCCPYLSLGTAKTAGVVSTGGNFTGNVETKNLFSNPNNWKVKDATENLTGFGGNLTKYDYGFFYKKLGSPTTNNFSGSLPGASGTYYSSAAVTTSGSWTVGANQKIMILVNGNLTIGKEIAVPTTSFLAFIVSGNISIDKNLGVNPNANLNSAKVVEGVYLADGFIKTVPDGETALPNKKFVASGIFVAYGGFSFGRDLGSYNSSYAAEYFEYRPDFLVNFPPAFGFNRLTWQEVAP